MPKNKLKMTLKFTGNCQLEENVASYTYITGDRDSDVNLSTREQPGMPKARNA